MDKKVNLSDIDRLFIAANVEIIKNSENPDNQLCRFEVIEIFLRLASLKYKETGICATYSEAFEKILNEKIFPNYQPYPWQEFRD